MQKGPLITNLNPSRRGQSATELAVFGAILIFLIGGIIRAGLANSYAQNADLKAMRWALLQSWKGSQNDSSNRNRSAIMVIEDRLSVDFGKYGSLDRTPSIAQGSGTLTNTLLRPVDLGDLEQNISLMDVFVNGVHLTFTTAGKREYDLSTPPAGVLPSVSFDYIPSVPPAPPVPVPAPPVNALNGTHHNKGWDLGCANTIAPKVGGAPGEQTITYYPCPLLYTRVINGQPGFCSKPDCIGSGESLSLEERFDLNRNDDFRDDPRDGTVTSVPRKYFGWQWVAVPGVSSNISIDAESGNYPSFDVDNDRQEEVIYGVSSGAHGIITGLTVLDFQHGDLDFSNEQGSVGLLQDTAIYTRPRNQAAGVGRGGTYFEIKEGKLFNPGTKTVVRSASKKDQVDVVERRFRLSNDTGRMCNGEVPGVEVCVGACKAGNRTGTCFEGNVNKTCFDCNDKMLYVRSRLLDARGHKWTTDASGDLNLK